MAREERNRDRAWRRFDADNDFQDRSGALDRRWGYGDRMAPGYDREQGGRPAGESEFEYDDEYNAPDYWVYQREWMRPGPFTGVGPRGYQRSDDRIRDDVCDRLTQHPEIDASDMEIKVENGEVTISGKVDSRRTKRLAEANIEMIPGVVDVHNRLRLTARAQREEPEKSQQEREDPFPGGPTPTGPAGY